MPDAVERRSALAVLPARGGSRRIPRKNIRPFLGVPLLARTLDILRQTALFDRLVVSTDDPEIASVAVRAGADVPFLRDPALADDFTGTRAVICDAIERLSAKQSVADVVACVYPGAVLSLPADYQRAMAMLEEPGVSFVLTVAAFPSPIQRALRRRADDGCEMIWPEHLLARTQDLEPAYHDAGQFYLGTRQSWFCDPIAIAAQTRMLQLPPGRVQDIDTIEDWTHAEWLARKLGMDEPGPSPGDQPRR